MKAAVYYNNKDIRIQEMPVPKIGNDEILVKVKASGICGSDVMEWYRIKKAPLILGHEITGEIIEKGCGVKNYKIGDRVFVSHHVPCNTCKYCLSGNHTVCETLHTTNFDPGGFAEYIRVPKLNVDRGVFILPEEITYEQGVFIEPLACVVRAQRLAQIKLGDTVLVLGSGMSGILHIALSRILGASRIIATDVSEYRLNSAKKFGADFVISADEDVPSKLLKLNNNKFADVVIICTGAYPAFIQSLKSVDRGGTILFFAPIDKGVDLPVPVNEFWKNSIKLMTSYGASAYDLKVAMDLISTKRIPVQDMITHKLPLKDIAEGFKIVAEAKESLKVIILFGSFSFCMGNV